MNYLKLPPQLINMSTAAGNGSKKNQLPQLETANGLVNIAPLCESPYLSLVVILFRKGGGCSE